jgi:hypothetical protein
MHFLVYSDLSKVSNVKMQHKQLSCSVLKFKQPKPQLNVKRAVKFIPLLPPRSSSSSLFFSTTDLLVLPWLPFWASQHNHILQDEVVSLKPNPQP